MYVIKRYVDVKETNLYKLQIDENYAKNINEYIIANLAEGEVFVPLTPKDIIDFFLDHNSNPRIDEKICMCYKLHRETPIMRNEVLFEMVKELVEDDVWDSYGDCIDSDTYGYEDEVETIEEK